MGYEQKINEYKEDIAVLLTQNSAITLSTKIESLFEFLSNTDEIIRMLTGDDKLERIFMMQKQFDARVQVPFDNQKKRTPTVGMHVETYRIDGYKNLDWVKQLTFSLLTECVEIIDAIGWKHWKRPKVITAEQNDKIKEEIADAWHFIVSLTLRAGLTATDVMDSYEKKWKINQQRQDEGY